MAKTIKLLLTENVDALGIVGDVVNVRTGYARNYLLPRNIATTPSDELVKALSDKRAKAQELLSVQRKQREQLAEKIKNIEVTLTRSCNDMGILYASITQQDVANALNEMGHAVKPRDVRIAQTIKRIDNYDVHVKLDSDLDSVIKLHVKPDRELDLDQATEEAAGAGAAANEQQTEAKRMEAAEEAAKATRGTWGAAKPASSDAAPAGDKKHKKDGGEKKADKEEKKGKHDGEKKSKKKD